jgi:nucleotide-binding universal stress UspA family protein
MKGSRILVPLDGHPDHDIAAPLACSLARLLGAQLVLLTVADASPSGRARARLDEIAASCKGVETKVEILVGDPMDTILKYCRRERITTVAMATHGKSGIEAFWSGSLAARLLPHLDISTLIIPI